jgi:transposase
MPDEVGRPGLPPGRYVRLLLIGYFEGLDAERAIAWRAADSFALREFLGLVLPDAPPDHSTISRTRRLIDLETHEAVFTWMLQRGGCRVGHRQDRRHRCDHAGGQGGAAEHRATRHRRALPGLPDEAGAGLGHETPTRADLARIDRTRKKKGSNDDWTHPHDPDAKIMRRVHLRGHTNIRERLLIHAGGFNFGLLMRRLIGVGTPRGCKGGSEPPWPSWCSFAPSGSP